MNAFFMKIALIIKTILAALGMGGCLPAEEEHILEDIVDDFIKIENSLEK